MNTTQEVLLKNEKETNEKSEKNLFSMKISPNNPFPKRLFYRWLIDKIRRKFLRTKK